MNAVLKKLEDAIKEMLIGLIESNMDSLFADVNEKVADIGTQVCKTPASWNQGIFSMIKNLSETLILPIAGTVITAVLCIELINMVTGKNNMADFETWEFFKWFIKAFAAIYLVTHTFDLVMGIFELAHSVVIRAANTLNGNTNINVSENLHSMIAGLEDESIGTLLMLSVDTLVVSLSLKIMSVIITVVLYGRMIEIYSCISLAPIPFATLTSSRFREIGDNYVKSMAALAFQAFLIMISVTKRERYWACR